MRYFCILILTATLLSCGPIDTTLELESPNGAVSVLFKVNEINQPTYSVRYNGETIITESPLALDFSDGVWGADVVIKKSKRQVIHEQYALVVGKSDSAHNVCHEMMVQVAEKTGDKRKINLFFRAYDDGAAFRYQFPKQRGMNDFELVAEKTEFRFPADHNCWALQLGSYTTSYEKEFEPTTIHDIAENALVGLPLTIEIENGPTVAITEANLTEYAGMYINGSSTDNALVSSLSPLPDEDVCVRGETPHLSPWRVIMIGEKPGDLIESNLVLNLNEPLALDDPSWIKAGRVAWDWWSGQVVDSGIESGMNNATMKHYIDFAAEQGLEYMLIDAGWSKRLGERRYDILETIPDIDMPELVRYANDRGVDILIWLHWTSVKAQIDEAFPLYEQWGVKGVKIDFMDRDDQEMVNFYHEMVQKAAKHHLMVDFHGAYKPTGLRRTWPNLMTREGILGLEYLKWSDPASAEHNVTAPFTRMLAGPMDYTPGGFRNVTPEEFESQRTNPMVPTTRCHQLAMFVVYESPLQMLADAPVNYRGQPGLDFIAETPATWDETRVLAGEIGDYIVVARRSGDTWLVGAMTDELARELELPLDFLDDGEYKARLWADGPGADTKPTRVKSSQTNVTAKDVLHVDMAPRGGFSAILQK